MKKKIALLMTALFVCGCYCGDGNCIGRDEGFTQRNSGVIHTQRDLEDDYVIGGLIIPEGVQIHKMPGLFSNVEDFLQTSLASATAEDSKKISRVLALLRSDATAAFEINAAAGAIKFYTPWEKEEAMYAAEAKDLVKGVARYFDYVNEHVIGENAYNTSTESLVVDCVRITGVGAGDEKTISISYTAIVKNTENGEISSRGFSGTFKEGIFISDVVSEN